jgi:Hydrazine synthase alpha subunit middle domain
MNAAGRVLAAGAALLILIAMCGFSPSPSDDRNADFIVTAAPVYKPLAELRGGERFPNGAHLLIVHNGKAEPLVADFAASADADVSYDGKSVLFAGKKAASDPWQIWELNFEDCALRKITSTADDAVRPFHLPGGRLVWAQRTRNGFQLESSDDGRPKDSNQLNPTAGPGVLPLTYLRASAFPTGVLHDGRILFESGFPLGSGSTPEIYLVYADGSGVESYRCDHGSARWGASQLQLGDLVFTHGASLARFTPALAHEEPVAAPVAQYAGAIAEIDSTTWLLSARTANNAYYSISRWQPGDAAHPLGTKLETVLSMSGMNLVEPVLVAPHERPNRHPSGLHPWNYANLMALDARVSRDGMLRGVPASVRLETQDANGRTVATGTAPVEQDGSFFVSVPADQPIRFALLDRKGVVLRQEHGWFWIRGGEQRYCVGCHAGPERAPENHVPSVLMRTTTPVDLTGSHDHAHASQGGQ